MGKDIPQAFLAPDRDRGVTEKGKGASQGTGLQQERQDQAVSVCEELCLRDTIRPRACGQGARSLGHGPFSGMSRQLCP